jgi:hypothetical protein
MPPAAPATTALTILLSYLGREMAVMRGRGSLKLFEKLVGKGREEDDSN